MLSFRNLFVGYDQPILLDITGQINKSDIVFLIGPNGSGKSALLKTLSQVILPKSGVISSEEHPVYLSADYHFQPGLTGNDLLDLYGYKNSPWFDGELLDLFEVKNLLQLPLETLSSGERQRIYICSALSHKSSLVLMDEPLNHLDWNFSLKLKSILLRHTQRGRAFLISNHDLNWSLSFEKTQTWVLFKKSIFLKNATESVLADVNLQEVFKIKTEIISNQNKKIISLSEL